MRWWFVLMGMFVSYLSMYVQLSIATVVTLQWLFFAASPTRPFAGSKRLVCLLARTRFSYVHDRSTLVSWFLDVFGLAETPSTFETGTTTGPKSWP